MLNCFPNGHLYFICHEINPVVSWNNFLMIVNGGAFLFRNYWLDPSNVVQFWFVMVHCTLYTCCWFSADIFTDSDMENKGHTRTM